MSEVLEEKHTIITALDAMASSLGKEFYAKAHGLLKGLGSNSQSSFYIHADSEKLELCYLENMLSIKNAIAKKSLIKIKYKISPISLRRLK